MKPGNPRSLKKSSSLCFFCGGTASFILSFPPRSHTPPASRDLNHVFGTWKKSGSARKPPAQPISVQQLFLAQRIRDLEAFAKTSSNPQVSLFAHSKGRPIAPNSAPTRPSSRCLLPHACDDAVTVCFRPYRAAGAPNKRPSMLRFCGWPQRSLRDLGGRRRQGCQSRGCCADGHALLGCQGRSSL